MTPDTPANDRIQAGHGVRSASGRVRAVPPAQSGEYWRLSCYDEDGRRIRQTTGGRTRDEAARRVAEEEQRLAAHGLPGAGARRGDQLFDFFLSETRPKFPHSRRLDQAWSASYTQQAASLVDGYLRPVLGSLPLRVWSQAWTYRALDRCPTNYVVSKSRRILSSVVTVGLENGFLRPDQAGLHRVSVPLRCDRRPARHPAQPPRGDQPLHVLPDEVPGIDQVRRLSQCDAAVPAACRSWWSLAINLLAYGGLREGELFALAAPAALELGDQLLAVTWQVDEPAGLGKRLVAPKNGRSRLAAICRATPPGYPLWDRLQTRAHAALAERDAGRNPEALIIPAPRGGWWSRSNFRRRCFVPAALAAGWETLPWTGPVRHRRDGRWVTELGDRLDFRHTLHALRHHYACTARDNWGWTVAELCANGGWTDPAFVMSRYYGLTPEVHATALAKLNRSRGRDR